MGPRRKAPSDEELKSLYLNDKMSVAKIGAIFSVSTKTVYKFIKRLGINRSISEARKGVKTKRTVKKEIRAHLSRSGNKSKNTIYCQKCAKEVVEYGEVIIANETIKDIVLKYCKDCLQKHKKGI